MAAINELFFYVSGEHKTFPYAEVKAILEAEGYTYEKVAVFPRILLLESDAKCLSSVADRSAFTKNCGLVALRCEARIDAILDAAKNMDYSHLIEAGQTFSVKIERTMINAREVKEIERIIGRIILRQNQDVKVKLANPDVCFFGFFSTDLFLLGKILYEPTRVFLKRKLSSQPFSHPSSMVPKLARGMVNLARVRAGSIVLDPFCGTGSVLIEAGLIGCRILGSEISPEMVRGAKLNLSHFNIPRKGLVVSDARHCPFIHVDGIITDPPYGRSSSTYGLQAKKIFSDFLTEALNILPHKRYLSIASPDNWRVREISEELGYISIEHHLVREHKSLTRDISVIQKP